MLSVEAAKLLMNDQVALVDVSTMAGFEGRVIFKVFKKFAGVTPAAIVKRVERSINHHKWRNKHGDSQQDFGSPAKGKAKDVKVLVQEAVDGGLSTQAILNDGRLQA